MGKFSTEAMEEAGKLLEELYWSYFKSGANGLVSEMNQVASMMEAIISLCGYESLARLPEEMGDMDVATFFLLGRNEGHFLPQFIALAELDQRGGKELREQVVELVEKTEAVQECRERLLESFAN